MSRLKSSFVCLVLAASAVPFVGGSGDPEHGLTSDGYVLSKTDAYVLLHPQAVPGTGSEKMRWSPDGSMLLIVRTSHHEMLSLENAVAGKPYEDGGERSVVAFSPATGKLVELWKGDAQRYLLNACDWMGGHTALIQVTEAMRTVDPSRGRPGRQSLIVFDVDRGTTSTPISYLQENGFPDFAVVPSPKRQCCLVVSQTGPLVAARVGATAPPKEPIEYAIVQSDGTASRVQAEDGLSWWGWSPDGNDPLFFKVERPVGRPVSTSMFRFDMSTGKMLKLDREPQFEPRAVTPISVDLSAARLSKGDASVPVKAAWLQGSSDHTETLVGSPCSAVQLSPALNAVAFISDGLAVVRPIVKIPRDEFLTALRRAQRDAAVARAKQVGLSAMMYGSDYDDCLPPSGMDISDILGPYAKDSGIFDGFVYTFSGSSLTDLTDPSKTQIGYSSGPGGKAVVFADGHVEWQPDK